MKVFLYNHSGSLNRGCEAIIRGTVNVLNQSESKNEFVLSSYSPQEDELLKELVGVTPFKASGLNKIQYIKAAIDMRLKKDEHYSVVKQYAGFFDQAQHADVCLSVGGDTYCYGDNPTIRILTDELIKRGKKTVLWAASIGEEDLTPKKESNLARMDAVFARETLTASLLIDKKINPNVFVLPDPAFTLESEVLPLPIGWQRGNTVGINISPLVVGIKPGIMKYISSFIKYILRQTNMSIVLIPHVTAPSNNDMTMLNELYRENKESAKGRLLVLPENLTAAQYKGYISRLRFLVASRTHACIAAYSSCLPVIVLGYSVKSKGISRDVFGNERFVLDTRNIMDAKEIVNSFMALKEQEEELKNILAKNIPPLIERAYAAGERLARL
ncbi:MAG TPA: polysaccharide pyruvyl transferase family protein [Clostridia bacterium]|nr:polysaccharide pyruvyl transferase family protein [Clostridia bacterium]